jgi:hypothetical protein
VFCAAIVASAAAVILSHNHPSGDPTPSSDDRLVTEQLVAAGRLLDIPVHDHVILGSGRYVSFAEAGCCEPAPLGGDIRGSKCLGLVRKLVRRYLRTDATMRY